MKPIDLSKSVYELVQQYPEVADIMHSLGFTEIKKRAVLNSVGRMMTIPRGSKMKGIAMESIVAAFNEHGFTIENGEGESTPSAEEQKPGASFTYAPAQTHTELLKSYLHRLNAGEDLETVRKEFVDNFHDVEAADIMRAEQEMMAGGTPLKEVQRLCDVHSALFHGNTREERIANAEQEVAASLSRERQKQWHATAEQNADTAAAYREIDGHPLQTFFEENDRLEELIALSQEKLQAGDDMAQLLAQVRQVAIHYAKKGDLIYPLLKVKYDIYGPSQVMWTVDDEIRDELSALVRDTNHGEDWATRALAVLTRAKEMIYKENNILFPLCAANFTAQEWQQIYRDSKDYAVCLGVEPKRWEDAEQEKQPQARYEGEVVMPGGHLTVEQLTALLNTLPLEITFVDADNINRFFNEGPKVFKRPTMAIDREVFSCHPPKIEPMVRAIIEDFRNGTRDRVPIWMEKNGRSMLVMYMAVRDRKGKYVGTVEVVQDMEFAKEHFIINQQ